VRVTLKLSPPGARVFVDGAERADNPLLLDAGPATHSLRVEADGHEPRTSSFVADGDRQLEIKLRRRAPKRRGLAREVERTFRPRPTAKKPAEKQPTRLYDDL
jgi:hypothetical protein